jgi:hypothetical protein
MSQVLVQNVRTPQAHASSYKIYVHNRYKYFQHFVTTLTLFVWRESFSMSRARVNKTWV